MTDVADFWYNYVTKEYEAREAPTTDEEAQELLLQLVAAQRVFRCRRLLGDDIINAMIYTLRTCAGLKEDVT